MYLSNIGSLFSRKHAAAMAAHRRTQARRRRRLSLLLEHLEDRTAPAVSISNVPSWIGAGPGPITDVRGTSGTIAFPNNSSVGAVESLVAEPLNGGGFITYAGTVNGGVWRSDNIDTNDPAQIQWRPLTDRQPSLATGSLALDPLDSSGNTLWVGTGSFQSASFGNFTWNPYRGTGNGAPAVGLLKTSDGGNTWIPLGAQLAGQRIMSVVPTTLFDSISNQQVVLVATADGSGVLRSSDGGQTFQAVVDETQTFATGKITYLSGTATDLVADPNDSSRFYAAVAGKGIYVSNNGGENWFNLDNGSLGVSSSVFIRLAVHADGDGTVLYAAVAGIVPPPPTDTNLDTQTLQVTGVFRAPIISSNGLASWSAVGPATLPTLSALRFAGLFAVAADPTNPNLVYVSGVGDATTGDATIYLGNATRNIDPSMAWTSISGAGASGTQPHPDSRHLMFLNASTLVETDDGGIYSLTSPQYITASVGWVTLNGNLQNTEFFSAAYDGINHTIFGGTQDNGTPIQPTRGAGSWEPLLNGGGDGGVVAAGNNGTSDVNYYFQDSDPIRNGVKMQLADQAGDARFSGLDPADQATMKQNAGQSDSSYPVAVSPSDPNRILFGMSHLYESFDGGDTVTDVTTFLFGTPTAFACGLNNSNAAYLAVNSSAILGTNQLLVRTTSDGFFSSVTAPRWGSAFGVQIVVDPLDFRTAYVLDSAGRVWMTTDAGATAANWTELTDNLGGVAPSVRAIALYDPNPSQVGRGVLLAAGRGGVYRRLPDGQPGCSWSQFGGNLPNVLVTSLQYVPPDVNNPGFGDFLIASTYGRGVWTLPSVSNYIRATNALTVTEDSSVSNYIVIDAVPNNPNLLQVSVNQRVEYSGPPCSIDSITVNEGAADDYVTIEQDFGIPITVHMGSGRAIVNISPLTGNFNATIQADVFITRGSGLDTLFVSDGNDTALGMTWTLTGSSVFNNNVFSHSVNYDGMDVVTLDTGPGSLAIDVAPVGQNLDAIQGSLVIHGNGSDTLTVNDQLNPNPSVWDVSGTAVTRTWFSSGFGLVGSTINYSGVANLVLDAGKVPGQSSSMIYLSSLAQNLDELPHSEWTPRYTSQGSVTVNGGGADTLILDDQNNANASAWSVTGDNITRSYTLLAGRFPNITVSVPINYSGIGTLALNAGQSANTITLSPIAQNLDELLWTPGYTRRRFVTVNGGGAGTLILDDQNNPDLVTEDFITNNTLTRQGPTIDPVTGFPVYHIASITYGGLAGLALNTGVTPNLVHVEATAAATTVNAGPGNALVDVSPTAKNLDALAGALTVHGGGATQLVVNDQKNVASKTYTVTANTVSRTGTAVMTYANMANLALYAGTGSNVLYISGTAAGTKTDVYGGAGYSAIDEFVVTSRLITLDSIQGPLGLHGQSGPGGESYELLNDALNTVRQTYTLTAGTVNRSGIAPITYDHLVADDLYTSQLTSAVINVQSNAAKFGTGVAIGPEDQVTLGSPAPLLGRTLANIQGVITMASYRLGKLPSIVVDDSGDTTAHPQAVLSAYSAPYDYQLTDLAPAQIIFGFDPATPVSILGGSGNDMFTVASPLAATGINIDGGGGTNTLIGPNTANDWNISGLNRGALGPVSFVSFGNLVGGSDVDSFKFSPSGRISGTIDGGGGGDWLDYSQVTVPVAVNLSSGSATRVVGGVVNIQNVRGGSGRNTLTGNALGNILVGGAGANVLIGGSGRSLLIGGKGKGAVTGNSGNDILIAGSTDYDSSSLAHDQALESILAEWQSANSYATRISHIKNGGGRNGSNKLVWGVTVRDNSNANTLTGGGGASGQNWFFANLTHTTTNKTPGEQLN